MGATENRSRVSDLEEEVAMAVTETTIRLHIKNHILTTDEIKYPLVDFHCGIQPWHGPFSFCHFECVLCLKNF